VARRIKVTKDLYASVLAAWLEKPSIAYVCEQLELPRSVVQRMVKEGAPELGLDPLPQRSRKKAGNSTAKRKPKANGSSNANGSDRDLTARTVIASQEAEQHVERIRAKLRALQEDADQIGADTNLAELEQKVDGTMAELEAAKLRAEVEEKRIANVSDRAIAADATQRSATEAAAARMSLKHCMTMSAIYGHLAENMLDAIEGGKLEMPETVTPRTVMMLASALDKLTTATERAVKLEKGRAGEPDKVIGVQVAVLLDACTPEELEVVATTGRLPTRLKMLSDGD
jgi:hypothetical protein